MELGNNFQVTAKEIDFPSGWQFIFAAHGARIHACTKSGFCQGWLSRDCEQSNHELKGQERLYRVVLWVCVRESLCFVSTNPALRLWSVDKVASFKTFSWSSFFMPVSEGFLFWLKFQFLFPSLCPTSGVSLNRISLKSFLLLYPHSESSLWCGLWKFLCDLFITVSLVLNLSYFPD